jgi:uncharacterized protein (DUF608 family)
MIQDQPDGADIQHGDTPPDRAACRGMPAESGLKQARSGLKVHAQRAGKRKPGTESILPAPENGVQKPAETGPSEAPCCGKGPIRAAQQPHACTGSGCLGQVNRRQLLGAAGAGLVSLGGIGGTGLSLRASETAGSDPFVPADKKLNPAWVRGLFERGRSAVYQGQALETIGMPVGGIAAGQVYLRGDGTLGCWQIFNRRNMAGRGQTNYRHRKVASPVKQGFAVIAEQDGRRTAHSLSREGFPDVSFIGEYPIGTVRYLRQDFPVQVQMEVFSPFIPLNALDSSLPATVFHITLANTSNQKVEASVLGWLENAVCLHRASQVQGRHRNRIVREPDRTLLVHTAEPLPAQTDARRPKVVLADFEGGDYGDWTVTGEAFGAKPATRADSKAGAAHGFRGQGWAGSEIEGDKSRGKLTSPPFLVSRKYLNFLLGGGPHAGQACMNLLVDGKVVRTATGFKEDRLAWHCWDVTEFEGQPGQLAIVDRTESRSWGHVLVDQIELSDEPAPIDQLDDFGSMVLALAEPAASSEVTGEQLNTLGPIGNGIDAAQEVAYSISERRTTGLSTRAVELAPGAKQAFTFVLSWHFPNRSTFSKRFDMHTGHFYATRFGDAAEVAKYVLAEHDRLAEQTRRWHETYYDSTLPHWLLDRLHGPVANLAAGTCQWWANGRFWAWEGVGCCPGTCTHVWNYAHAAARLFPELERSVRRMQDLGEGFKTDGMVGTRGELDGHYAADGQAGTVLKCYREHQMSADDAFLKRHWSRIKKVLEYSIAQDGNQDGLIENRQPNTFDINFYGLNTFVGSLYLAALRAGEEMARERGDDPLARRLRKIFESGQKHSIEQLWNGEYFIQRVDLNAHPEHQYGHGCLSDQLFGQGWAHQVGLGYLYPAEQVRRALEAVYRYNWAPNVGPYNAAHKPHRKFASPGEAGLFTCTWPKSKYLKNGVLYRNEVWTGIEYQVAGHMIREGMLTEALAIVRGIHERYHPLKHNPFNEIECGDHYARALASWGVLTAISGYEYHGPKNHLGFSPRLGPEDFRSSFTAAEGWGTFSQKREGTTQQEKIELRWGRLRLRSLAFSLPEAWRLSQVKVAVAGRSVPATHQAQGQRVTIMLSREVTVNEGESIEVAMS